METADDVPPPIILRSFTWRISQIWGSGSPLSKGSVLQTLHLLIQHLWIVLFGAERESFGSSLKYSCRNPPTQRAALTSPLSPSRSDVLHKSTNENLFGSVAFPITWEHPGWWLVPLQKHPVCHHIVSNVQRLCTGDSWPTSHPDCVSPMFTFFRSFDLIFLRNGAFSH